MKQVQPNPFATFPDDDLRIIALLLALNRADNARTDALWETARTEIIRRIRRRFMNNEMTEAVESIRTLEPLTIPAVLAIVENIWEERPAVADEDDDLTPEQRDAADDAFDKAADAYHHAFMVFLSHVWELSTCTDANRMGDFAEDPDTATAVFATNNAVIEFDDAHPFGPNQDEFFAFHTWDDLATKNPMYAKREDAA